MSAAARWFGLKSTRRCDNDTNVDNVLVRSWVESIAAPCEVGCAGSATHRLHVTRNLRINPVRVILATRPTQGLVSGVGGAPAWTRDLTVPPNRGQPAAPEAIQSCGRHPGSVEEITTAIEYYDVLDLVNAGPRKGDVVIAVTLS